jgi:phosphoribosylglycinamide formyltransferase 2
LSPSATRVLLCGSGELGKEVVIELQRLGVALARDESLPAARAKAARAAQAVSVEL